MRDPAVRDALAHVPRETFLPRGAEDDAYLDQPLAIGAGQTISAPHMVAMMAEALDVRAGSRVLEVGGGSGYHAAVLAEIARNGHVWSVERVPELAQSARDALARAGYAERVTVIEGDGSRGVPEQAPFDRVSVACAAPRVPRPLLAQLAVGGRLVAPVGPLDEQMLVVVEKEADGRLFTRSTAPCRFVPLVGEFGYPAESASRPEP